MPAQGDKNKLTETEARRLLAECADDDLVRTLQEIFNRFQPTGWPTIDQVAALAETSTRSLQRRLAGQGETFARVSDQTRAKLAMQLLKCTNRSRGQIATELGYTERTNFVRAFKRWTGTTPEQYRSSAAANDEEANRLA